MTIDSSGKLGIGDPSPTHKLTVAGAISGSSTLEAVGATVLGSTLNVSGAITGADNIGTTGGFLTASAQLKGLSLVLEGQTAIDKNRNATFAAVSGSGTLQAVGATILGGALNVTGAVTLAGPASGSAAGDGSFLAVTPAGVVILDTPAGQAGTPGGSDTQVQFNDGGSFGGNANLIWDDTNFKVTGNISGSGTTTIGTSITATGPVSGSGAGSFGSLVLNGGANLQSAGISNAGAIAGATTVSATGNITTTGGQVSGSGALKGLALIIENQTVISKNRNITAAILSGSGAGSFGAGLSATGAVSGSGIGSFGSLVLDGGANLQSAGITNAGAIAGATTVTLH
jgi:hypothetical protein